MTSKTSRRAVLAGAVPIKGAAGTTMLSSTHGGQ
jgi:hypothetical protein